MKNHSNGIDFDLRENVPVGETYFHMNGFECKLNLKLRQRLTLKWPIPKES